jgi:hypothetical protein
MRELIRHILKENAFKDDVKQSIKDNGLLDTIKYVGGTDSLVKILYDGDIMKFYEDTGFNPVRMTDDGMDMYIDDLIIRSLGIEVRTLSRGDEVNLGDFRWTSGGMNYKFSTSARSVVNQTNGQKLWRVIGTSGDHGFGYGFITKKNTIGKRGRRQIFNQVIDKYDLQQYL